MAFLFQRIALKLIEPVSEHKSNFNGCFCMVSMLYIDIKLICRFAERDTSNTLLSFQQCLPVGARVFKVTRCREYHKSAWRSFPRATLNT